MSYVIYDLSVVMGALTLAMCENQERQAFSGKGEKSSAINSETDLKNVFKVIKGVKNLSVV